MTNSDGSEVTPAANPAVARLAFAALLAGATAIACAPIFVRLSELGPSATAFYRLALALPVLWLWVGLEQRRGQPARRPTGLRELAQLGAAGALFAADLALWHWSIRYTSVANATLLANFAPVVVAFGAWLLFRERFRAQFLLGLGLALAGVVVLMGDSTSLDARHALGDLLGLLTALFYGGYLLAVSRLRRRLRTATIMAWSGTATALALFPLAVLSGEGLVAATWSGWSVLLALALVSQAGGQSLIAYALAHLPAALSAVSLLLQPLIAALLAWVLLGEGLRPWQGVGAAVLLAGIHLARRASRV